jgi:hypothetical protein
MLSIGMVALAISDGFIGARAYRLKGPTREALLSLMQVFGRVGRIGLLLFWITGPWMFIDRYGGDFGAMPRTFHVKLAFVLVATIAIVVIDYTPRRFNGNVVRVGGMVGALSLVLALVFAVATFN